MGYYGEKLILTVSKLVRFILRKKKSEDKFSSKFDQKKLKKTLLLKKDKDDSRDYDVKATLVAPPVLPKQVDLRQYASPIKNQLNLGCCSGFGFGAAYELMKNKQFNESGLKNEWDTSELYIYYNERVIMGTVNKDSGAYLRDGCKVMTTNGASMEYYWPYITSKFKDKPSWSSYFAGRFMRCESYHRCFSIDDIKLSLSQNMPVVFGVTVYNNFFNYKNGIYNETSGNVAGGHCMCCVGYDEDKKALLIRNSWGIGWGELGYCWMSYDVFTKNLMDAWVVIPYGWKGGK